MLEQRHGKFTMASAIRMAIQAFGAITKYKIGTMALVLAGSGLFLVILAFYFLPFFFGSSQNGLNPVETAQSLLVSIGTGLLSSSLIAFLTQRAIVSRAQSYENWVNSVLIGQIDSINSIMKCGIRRIFPSRSLAITEIDGEIQSKDVTEVDIIGISLNDFVREKGDMHGTWQVIRNKIMENINISNGSCKTKRLHVRLLAIDPDSNGAFLRSRGERRETYPDHRLRDDVYAAILDIKHFRKSLPEQGKEADNQKFTSIELRLYRCSPTFFMIWTNSSAYVQPYYFWRSRDGGGDFPLFKYLSSPEEYSHRPNYPDEQRIMHKELKDHFDWIWDRACITSDEYWDNYNRGYESGALISSMSNIFTNQSLSLNRFIVLLKNVRKRVYIQGISLRSYFDPEENPDLYEIMALLFKNSFKSDNNDLDLRILVIDPDCDQAKYRAFREANINGGVESYSKYTDDHHKRSTLYKHVRKTIDEINKIEKSLSADYCEGSQSAVSSNGDTTREKRNLLKLYDTSPYAFILIIDDAAFVEQYHYGKPGIGIKTPFLLGKNSPVLEFSKPFPHRHDNSDINVNMMQSSGDQNPDSRHSVFDLLISHFTFAWELAKSPQNNKESD